MNRIGFVQPFGIDAPGGGSRILRSLLKKTPFEIASIVSSPRQPPACAAAAEMHLPYRPYFGRAEHTRFSQLFDSANPMLLPFYSSRLTAVCKGLRLSSIHSIAHWWDSLAAFEAAKRLAVPFFLSVHDDVRYTAVGDRALCERFGRLWRDAAGRYCISQELGEEYNRRYGGRSFEVVTDGVESCAESPKQVETGRLRVYFMGLFHIAYIENFRALTSALEQVAGSNAELTLRCGTVPRLNTTEAVPVRVLPFTTDGETLARDIASADLLYLPLPFGAELEAFSRFSLSTKLVTYLSTGVPILYHGPATAAAATLLARHGAATLVTTPGPEALRQALTQQPQLDMNAAANALALARSQFQLSEIAERFWSRIREHFAE